MLKAFDKDKALKYVDITNSGAAEIRDFLISKRCGAAFVKQHDGNVMLSDKEFNGDCRFNFVGEALDKLFGGWAFSIRSNSTCPQFIVGAFSEMLRTLSDEGQIAALYKSELASETTAVCSGPDPMSDSALGVRDLGGVLTFHVLLILLCWLGWLYPLHRRMRKNASEASALDAKDAQDVEPEDGLAANGKSTRSHPRVHAHTYHTHADNTRAHVPQHPPHSHTSAGKLVQLDEAVFHPDEDYRTKVTAAGTAVVDIDAELGAADRRVVMALMQHVDQATTRLAKQNEEREDRLVRYIDRATSDLERRLALPAAPADQNGCDDRVTTETHRLRSSQAQASLRKRVVASQQSENKTLNAVCRTCGCGRVGVQACACVCMGMRVTGCVHAWASQVLQQVIGSECARMRSWVCAIVRLQLERPPSDRMLRERSSVCSRTSVCPVLCCTACVRA